MKILLAVVIVALFGFAGGAAGWLIAFTTDDCSAAADRLDAMFRGVGVT
ncbi:MAG: hypothetical protein GWO24_23400, partial [Akkermansiaceae bacterium]|nr:hypothetical protein [Akkermansiaceae bacterium]